MVRIHHLPPSSRPLRSLQYFSNFQCSANCLASLAVSEITAPCLGEEKFVAFITPSLKYPSLVKVLKSVVSLKPMLLGCKPKTSYINTHLFSPLRFQIFGASQPTVSGSTFAGSKT